MEIDNLWAKTGRACFLAAAVAPLRRGTVVSTEYLCLGLGLFVAGLVCVVMSCRQDSDENPGQQLVWAIPCLFSAIYCIIKLLA